MISPYMVNAENYSQGVLPYMAYTGNECATGQGMVFYLSVQNRVNIKFCARLS